MAKYRSRSLSARSGGRGANNGVVEAVGNGDIGGGCGGGGGEDDGQGRGGEERRRRTRRREERRVIRGLPLQEAIKTRNCKSVPGVHSQAVAVLVDKFPTNIASVNLVMGCSNVFFFLHYFNTCPSISNAILVI